MTKKLSFAIAFTVVAVLGQTLLQAQSSRHTADYFRLEADKYEDRKISIDVAAVNEIKGLKNDDYGFLQATTYDTRNRTPGGTMFVVADKEEITKIIKKFGMRPEVDRDRGSGRDVETLRLTGVLRQTDKDKVYLDIAEEDVPASVLTELKESMNGKATKGRNAGPGKQGPGKTRNPLKGKGKK